MYNGTILNIYLVPHFYIVYIATQHGIEPNAALVAHGYITHNSGVLRNIAILSHLWRFPIYRLYHFLCISGFWFLVSGFWFLVSGFLSNEPLFEKGEQIFLFGSGDH
jgi:hypothetical protein